MNNFNDEIGTKNFSFMVRVRSIKHTKPQIIKHYNMGNFLHFMGFLHALTLECSIQGLSQTTIMSNHTGRPVL